MAKYKNREFHNYGNFNEFCFVDKLMLKLKFQLRILGLNDGFSPFDIFLQGDSKQPLHMDFKRIGNHSVEKQLHVES